MFLWCDYKNEEEHHMNIIGISTDYLTKPVNPSQILMTQRIHREIVNEHATAAYRSNLDK